MAKRVGHEGRESETANGTRDGTAEGRRTEGKHTVRGAPTETMNNTHKQLGDR